MNKAYINNSYISWEIIRFKHNTLMLFFIIMMLIFNYFFQNDIIAFMAISITFIFLIICKNEYIVANYIFLSFFSHIIQVNGINLFAFIGIAVILRRIIKNTNIFLNIILLWSFYVFIHMLSSGANKISFGALIPSFLLMALYSSCGLYDSKQYNLCVNNYLKGLFLSSWIGLLRAFNISRISEYLSNDFVYMGNDSTGLLRYAGLTYDCNFYAVLLVLGIILLIYDFNFNHRKRFSQYIMFISYMFFGILTFSKSFFLCILIIFGCWISSRNAMNKGLQIIITVIGAFIVCILFHNYFGEIIHEIIARFSSIGNFNSFTSGRGDIWKYYWSNYINSFRSVLIGNGIGYHGYWKGAHNLWLEILFNYGFLGMLCDITYYYIIKQCFFRKNIKVKYAGSKLMVLIFWLMQLFLGSYTFYSLTICILITFIARSKPKLNNLELIC